VKDLSAWPNLSQDPMVSRDAYQKLCDLIADPGSSCDAAIKSN